MALKFNGTDVQNVLYNGTQLEKLQLNGVTVWEHSQPVPSGTVIFEQGTAGSYTVNIPSAGEYYCTVVGAGGGGALSMHTTKHSGSPMPTVGSIVAGGGTGGYIKATVRFATPCTLNITVGSAGTSNHTYKLNQESKATWSVYGTAGNISQICSELTKVVLKANGGGRGRVDGYISGSSHTGYWYSDFTITTGTGGGWSWNNQTGITVFNITSATGNTGTFAEAGQTTGYGTFTATAPILLAPNMVSGYGAGGGGTGTVKRISGGTDTANWNHTAGTYGPNSGYVKIVKT